MYRLTVLFLIAISAVATVNSEEPSTTSTTPQPLQPVYTPPQQAPGYIPQQNYPYSDAYGGSIYDGLFYPQLVPAKPQAYAEQQVQQNYVPAVIPATQGALQFTLKVLAKFGLFVLGGATLLLIGGIFTTIICHLTPICVISFPALGGLDQESVRSLMTPDRISAAAALVQDAIGKYQRLQRATRS